MTNTLHHTTYSMRLDKYLKIQRKEQRLRAKPTAWLRSKVRKADRQKTKVQLIKIMLVNQFGEFSIDAYEHVKMNRTLRKR